MRKFGPISLLITSCRLHVLRNVFASTMTGIFLSGLAGGSAIAQSCDSYPYTLTNGTSADADQVMGNFNTVRNCANGLASGGTLTDTTLAGSTQFSGQITGSVGIGTSTATANGLQIVQTYPVQAQLFLDDFGVGGTQAVVRFRKAQGTSAAPTAVQLNDSLGAFQWAGYDGTTFTSRRADIYGIATEDWSATANGLGFVFRTTPNGSSGSSAIAERMRIMDDGKVGIGTSSPAYLLQVNGDAAKPGGGSWTDSSDRRLKKNIENLTGALDKLLRLRGVTYKWRNPNEHVAGTRAGLIAQEVEKIFPDWVSAIVATGEDRKLAGKDGKIKALTFPHDFNAYLIEAMRELKAKNDSLNRKLADLEAGNRQQAAALAEMKSQLDAIRARLATKAAVNTKVPESTTVHARAGD